MNDDTYFKSSFSCAKSIIAQLGFELSTIIAGGRVFPSL